MTESITHRRRNAVLATIAAGALLVGGGTYALWSDSANATAGEITAGRLALAADTVEYWDLSADRADVNDVVVGSTTLGALQGHAITDIDTWRIVPGDTVGVVIPYNLTLEGDNLVAELAIDPATLAPLTASTDTDSDGIDDWSISGWAFYNATGGEIDSGTALSDVVAYFQAPGTGQDAGTDDPNVDFVDGVGTSINGTAFFLVQVSFGAAATGDMQDVVAFADDIAATFTQVRSDVGHFDTP